MIETIHQIDRSLLLWVQGFGSPSLDVFWLYITKKENGWPLYLLILIFSQRYLGWRNFGFLIVSTVVLVTISDQITNLFKEGFMRLRPCHDPEISSLLRPLNYCGGKFSFYSGHASNGFASVTFFALLLKRFHKAFLLLFIWATLLAFSRVYLGVHYPSDIVVGAVFGTLWGILFAMAYRKWVLSE